MSAREAAGWARSRSHGVSVVPMIQCRPHGITNSTDFSVLVMKPALAADPVARHDEVDALARLDVERAPAAEHLLDLVGPDPAGVDDDLGPHLDLAVVLQVHQRATPTTRSPSRRKPIDLGARGDVGAVRRSGARDVHHQPGVVDLAVVVADRTGQLVGAQVGGHPRELTAEEVLVPRHAHVVLRRAIAMPS